MKSAGAALEGLGRLVARDAEEEKEEKEEAEEVEEEIVSKGASLAAPAPEEEDERGKRRREWERIRAKALMRRARARCELGGWQNLAGAEEDYKTLEGMDNLGPADRRMVSRQLRELPPRTKAAQEKEMAEMWGKLKDVSTFPPPPPLRWLCVVFVCVCVCVVLWMLTDYRWGMGSCGRLASVQRTSR